MWLRSPIQPFESIPRSRARFLIILSCMICVHFICGETSFCDSSRIIHQKSSFKTSEQNKRPPRKGKSKITERPLIELRENKDRAILFYRTSGYSSVFTSYSFSIEDGVFVDSSTSYVSDYNRNNDVILKSASEIRGAWMIGEGRDNHIQMVPIEKRSYLNKDYRVFDADCPVFIRLQDGVCVFRCSAGPWSPDHLKAMWKESIKPRRPPAIQCIK